MEKTEGQMLESIYDDMQEVKRQVKDLQLTLENETNRKIVGTNRKIFGTNLI